MFLIRVLVLIRYVPINLSLRYDSILYHYGHLSRKSYHYRAQWSWSTPWPAAPRPC